MMKALALSVKQAPLAGCTEIHALDPARANLHSPAGGRLHIDEPAESMTLFRVRWLAEGKRRPRTQGRNSRTKKDATLLIAIAPSCPRSVAHPATGPSSA